VLALAQARQIESILVTELSRCWSSSATSSRSVKSGPTRAKAAIARDGHFITKGGKRRAKLGRKKGYRPWQKHAEKGLERHRDGLSYRLIARNLGLPKNTVMAIAQRALEWEGVRAF
jgi:hypothetical protein